jgi:WD40 repeat protein
VLAGHEGPVYDAVFSADGARVVTASDDGTARIWRADDGLEIARLADPERGGARVLRAVFSRAADRILTTSAGRGRAWLWRGSGEFLKELEGFDSEVFGACFFPHDDRFVTVTRLGKVCTWNADGDRPRSFSIGATLGVWYVTVDPSGRYVLVGEDDGRARRFDLEGRPAGSYGGHEGTVTRVACSADGSLVLTAATDGTAALWTSDGERLATLRGHRGALWSVDVSSDGERIVTGSSDRTARTWCRRADELLRLAERHASVEWLTPSERARYAELVSR